MSVLSLPAALLPIPRTLCPDNAGRIPLFIVCFVSIRWLRPSATAGRFPDRFHQKGPSLKNERREVEAKPDRPATPARSVFPCPAVAAPTIQGKTPRGKPLKSVTELTMLTLCVQSLKSVITVSEAQHGQPGVVGRGPGKFGGA